MRISNSPYLPSYVKDWASYSTKREPTQIYIKKIYDRIWNFLNGVANFRFNYWLSQPFLLQSSKFVCPSISKFPEFSERAPTFIICVFLRQVMALLIKKIFFYSKKKWNLGYHLQLQFSQPFLNQFLKFLCPSISKFSEFFKTPQFFKDWMSITWENNKWK